MSKSIHSSSRLTELIRVKDDVLSADECAQYIELIDEYHLRLETHDTSLYKFRQLNLHTTNETKLIKLFANRCVEAADEYFTSLNLRQFITPYGFEQIRIKHYPKETNSRFDTHVDCYDTESAKRFLICLLYLNYNNGVTKFPQLGIECEPKPGRLVMFPPFWMFPHSGEIPTDQDKYILMTSLNYLPGNGNYNDHS